MDLDLFSAFFQIHHGHVIQLQQLCADVPHHAGTRNDVTNLKTAGAIQYNCVYSFPWFGRVKVV